MRSYEVIRTAVEEPGVKAVAAALKLSPALVYKWCEPAAEEGLAEASGSRNPLDRVRDLYLLTKDIRLIRWLCNEAGGFFVANPVSPEQLGQPKDFERNAVMQTRTIMREFSELLDEITASLENDPGIDSHEAIQIRQRWEDLKSQLESFVIRCERGHYR
jgi:hypothetical protein